MVPTPTQGAAVRAAERLTTPHFQSAALLAAGRGHWPAPLLHAARSRSIILTINSIVIWCMMCCKTLVYHTAAVRRCYTMLCCAQPPASTKIAFLG